MRQAFTPSVSLAADSSPTGEKLIPTLAKLTSGAAPKHHFLSTSQ